LRSKRVWFSRGEEDRFFGCRWEKGKRIIFSWEGEEDRFLKGEEDRYQFQGR
jgi:hypothetical protein